MTRTATRGQPDISLYRQVDSILREQIGDGLLRAGDRLPSEEALRAEYGISRGTVRQALDALERDGLIERAPGRGTFVRGGRTTVPHGRLRTPWHALTMTMPLRADRLTREGVALPPLAVSQALDLARSVEVPFFIRLSATRSKTPVGIKRYLRPNLKDHAAALAAVRDFRIALAEIGEAYDGEAWAEAILAEPRFAMQLDVALGAPLLSIWWVDRLDGRPAACTQMLLPGPTVAIGLADGGGHHAL
jgi:GntR family transcriptional regulator